ncbi:hypothetical protein PGT21_023178 [Puccinia graminis f. sp. tritici]|uniref:Uncharacterized protein n=1 Tax=Puccinia graminis f. sp. tritici TaxID=56615 RepID=A0A5B0QVF8_PUCGR|nr:hypothetical protein PGT21_023178 [Puccinia graminis f. sp. tritici]KAA1117150.1 hypothetical protein PGTUg99_036404 [Puccinia graminis f. sp. tritici]
MKAYTFLIAFGFASSMASGTEGSTEEAIRSSDWREMSQINHEPFVQLAPFLAFSDGKLIGPWGSTDATFKHESDNAKVTFQWCSHREAGIVKNLSTCPIAFVLRDVDGRKFVCGFDVPPRMSQVVELPVRRQHGWVCLNIKGKQGNIGQTSTAQH